MLIYIFVILISLSLKSFFTCAEMSLISSNKFKLHFLASEGNVLAQKALKLLAKPQLYLSTTLVGNNLSLIIASAVVSRLISQTVPEQWVNLATSTIMLPATLFLTELIPMSIGRLNATRLSLNLIRPLYYALYILYPFVKGFSFLSEKVVRLLGLKINEAQPFPSRDEIQHILESETQGQILLKEETELIRKVLQFHKILVDDVMISMDKVVSAPADISCREVVKIMQDSGYSRIPIYESAQSNIIGIIRPGELLNALMDKPVKRYVKKPYAVPLNTPLISVLWDLQVNARQTVIILGDNGGALGILTLEDIMEKVVGSIVDEYDTFPEDNVS